jgi:hypothetical protein
MSINGAAGTRAHPVAGQFAALRSDVFAGLIASTISVAYGLSFTALIFAPPLTPWIAYGIAATFLTTPISEMIGVLRRLWCCAASNVHPSCAPAGFPLTRIP